MTTRKNPRAKNQRDTPAGKRAGKHAGRPSNGGGQTGGGKGGGPPEPDPSPEPIHIDIDEPAITRQLRPLVKEVAAIPFEPLVGIELPIFPDETAPEVEVEEEPLFGSAKRRDIQGNTIPGFNKPHQQFLFFRIRRKRETKAFLRWIKPFVTSMEEVLAFRRIYRAVRRRPPFPTSVAAFFPPPRPPLCSAWINIAFSHGAIARLVGDDDADRFGEQSFTQGLAERSTHLGDPTDRGQPGHRDNWVVGGPRREADILVIVAADTEADLELVTSGVRLRAEAGLELLFEQRGDALPGAMHGREHFGFRDGVSQPGVRGRLSTATGDYITPRHIDPADPRSAYFAKPGQLLLWPGQFLLGEARQDPEHLTRPAPRATNFPAWAACGSYVVCRRLRQDVVAFWSFVIGLARAISVPPIEVASMMVGRWPSGAPISRVPGGDVPALGTDDWANNHFVFDDDTRPSNLRPIPGYGGDTYPDAAADVLGTVCPHFAHIRKSNPRDVATDFGKTADSLVRMILRRGIPFGRTIFGGGRITSGLLEEERGLMFVSYGATIEDQFEFLTRRWANSPVQPHAGGHDPIIGQVDDRGARQRFIDFPHAGGTTRVSIDREWVVPTGGGYFFAPPIGAIDAVLGA